MFICWGSDFHKQVSQLSRLLFTLFLHASKIIDAGNELKWPICWGHTVVALYLEVVYPPPSAKKPWGHPPTPHQVKHVSTNVLTGRQWQDSCQPEHTDWIRISLMQSDKSVWWDLNSQHTSQLLCAGCFKDHLSWFMWWCHVVSGWSAYVTRCCGPRCSIITPGGEDSTASSGLGTRRLRGLEIEGVPPTCCRGLPEEV